MTYKNTPRDFSQGAWVAVRGLPQVFRLLVRGRPRLVLEVRTRLPGHRHDDRQLSGDSLQHAMECNRCSGMLSTATRNAADRRTLHGEAEQQASEE